MNAQSLPLAANRGVVDHRMVDVIVVMPVSAKILAPATRKAREEMKSSIGLTIGVSTLYPVPSR